MTPGRVTLRPTGPSDFAALRRLFDDPALLDWGGAGRASDELIKAKYCGRRSPAVECFLVSVAGNAVGLAQLHVSDDDGEGGGMDLILLPPARGRGHGRTVVRQLLRRAADRGWRRVTVDPDLDNHDGIAFWRSVGFADASGTGPDRRALLEIVTPPGPERGQAR